ncbi:MAG TPA: hypothetical protein VG497_01930 [Kribbella sp.]|nr:hypothetical protein [Kribbella sp.]
MRSDDISADILGQPPSGDRDIGMRQGVILAWDELSGENVVDIEGQTFENLDVLISGIGTRFAVYDVVSILRRQSRYFIQGKIGAVNGAAGSAIQEEVYDYSDVVGSTGGAWIDPPSGVASCQAYIGSSKKAIVIWRADITCNNSKGEISWTASGASNVPVAAFAGMSLMHQATTAGTPSTAVKATLCGFYTVRDQVGLRQGLTTFTLKYRVSVSGSGVDATFGSPQITVIPL